MNARDIKITAQNTGKTIDVSTRLQKTRLRSNIKPEHKKPIKTLDEQENFIAPVSFLKPENEDPKLNSQETLVQPINFDNFSPLEIDESGDFALMLSESEGLPKQKADFKVGDKVFGQVVYISQNNIFVNLGPKVEASIDRAEFLTQDGQLSVSIGQTISAYVVSAFGSVLLSNKIQHAGVDEGMLNEALEKQVPIEGKVTALNKGGYEILLLGKKAFCPLGQIDDRFNEDSNVFVGKILTFLIERIEEGGRNIVVSRRKLLKKESQEKAKKTLENLEVGQVVDAVITRVTDFGAFADIGGVDGLIPRSEISHGHIDRILDVVSTGDRVSVQILSLEKNNDDLTRSRLSLSLKKTKEDPYTLHWNKITPGVSLEGKVVRLENFGAFVELFPGIDGLIHISELSANKVSHPKEILGINDAITVKVINVDNEERRISLSLREEVVKKKEQTLEKIQIARGQKVSGFISRIGRYGIFIELEYGLAALVPQSECGLLPHADLFRTFKIGDEINAVIIDIDDKNRIRASIVALEKMVERDSYLQFQSKETKKTSFGTFADLLNKNKKQ